MRTEACHEMRTEACHEMRTDRLCRRGVSCRRATAITAEAAPSNSATHTLNRNSGFGCTVRDRLTDVLTSNSLVDIANCLRLMPGHTLEDKDVCQSPKSSVFLSIVNSTAARKRNLLRDTCRKCAQIFGS